MTRKAPYEKDGFLIIPKNDLGTSGRYKILDVSYGLRKVDFTKKYPLEKGD